MGGVKRPWPFFLNTDDEDEQILKIATIEIEEPVSKCSILFEIKEVRNFNHRNIFNISRIKISV